jgi:deazaflavin-dependent oxidoreductase (nitroreductase family)
MATTAHPDRARPGRVSTAFNDTVAWLARHGVSVYGSRELAVRGRSSGEWRTVPVNVLTVDGRDYLVAPRGLTQWVRNLRVAGVGELRLGHRVLAFTATELPDGDKTAVLRAYLRKWRWEIGAFFPGLSVDSSDEEIAAVADRYPVFEITTG